MLWATLLNNLGDRGPVDLLNVSKALETAFPGQVRCVISDANSGKKGLDTLDGVAAGGARLAELVRRERPSSPEGYLSLVCHSLGGCS